MADISVISPDGGTTELNIKDATARTNIGNLADLTTTAKTNLVAAINEAAAGGGGGGTTDYNALSNKPQINNITLTGNKSFSDLGLATVSTSGSYNDLDDKPTIPTVSVSHSGTASSTTARKQQITVNNVAYDVDGSAYMEQEVILSTSADTVVTFTNNELIVDGKMFTVATSIWDLVPTSIVTNAGSCVITLPKQTNAATIGVRLYVR